jgi:hexokinase
MEADVWSWSLNGNYLVKVVVQNSRSPLRNKNFTNQKDFRIRKNVSPVEMLQNAAEAAVAAAAVMAAAATAVDTEDPHVKCMMPFVHHVAFKLRCRSNPAEPSRFIAESVIKAVPVTKFYRSLN